LEEAASAAEVDSAASVEWVVLVPAEAAQWAAGREVGSKQWLREPQPPNHRCLRLSKATVIKEKVAVL
jgi:hypothetical protein